MSLWPWGRQSGPDDPIPPNRFDASPGGDLPIHSFRGWTDRAFVTGRLRSNERPSDVLNRRVPVILERPRTAWFNGTDAPRLESDRQIDPFEFDLVLVSRLPSPVARSSAARRIHKVAYRVAVSAGDFEIEGLLHLFAGLAPEFAHHRATRLFLPVTSAIVHRAGVLVSDAEEDVALVNRHSIELIRQADWTSHAQA